MALSWIWLAAIGVGPLLLTALLYGAMRTLHLSMEYDGGQFNSTADGDKRQ